MRINVYSQELTNEVIHIAKESNGRVITGYPCFPNGELSGQPRIALSPLEISFWERDGRPDNLMGLTNPIKAIREEAIVYHAAQLILHSSDKLHHPPLDDDRSAVTFWLPKSQTRREEMAKAFERIAEIFRTAASGTGLD